MPDTRTTSGRSVPPSGQLPDVGLDLWSGLHYCLVNLIRVGIRIDASFSSVAPPAPRTINKEWEEAATERAKELNLDPITGMFSHTTPLSAFPHRPLHDLHTFWNGRTR